MGNNNDNIRQSYSYGGNSPDFGPDDNQKSESKVTKGFIPTPGQPFPPDDVQSSGESFEDMETADTSFDDARVAPNYRDPVTPKIKDIIDDGDPQGVKPEMETVYSDEAVQGDPFDEMQDQQGAPEQFHQEMNYNQAQDMNNYQGQAEDMDQTQAYPRQDQFGEEPYQEPVQKDPFEEMQGQERPEQFNEQMDYNQAQEQQYQQPETHDPHHPEQYQQTPSAHQQYHEQYQQQYGQQQQYQQQEPQRYDPSQEQPQQYIPPSQQGGFEQSQQGFAQQGQYGQQQPYQQPHQQPHQQSHQQPQPMYNAQHSGGGGGGGMSTPIKILIGGVVLIGIILAILFGTGVLGGKDDPPEEPAVVETEEATEEAVEETEAPVVEEAAEEEDSQWTSTDEQDTEDTEAVVVDEEAVQDYQDSIEPSPYLKDDIGYFSEDEALVLNAFIPLVSQGLEGEVYTRLAILVYDVSLDDDFYGIVDPDLAAMGIDPEVGEGTIGSTFLVIDDVELDFYVYRLYDEAGYGEQVASIDQLLEIYDAAVADTDADTNSAIDFEGIMAIFEYIIDLQISEVE